MKIGKLLFVLTLLTSVFTFAQEGNDECTRMRFLAQKYKDQNDMKTASMYYLKAETICGNFDQKDYDRVIGALRNVINDEKDATAKAAYSDTVLAAAHRAMEAGKYNEEHDLGLAYVIYLQEGGDRQEADKLFKRGIAKSGVKTHEGFVQMYYANLYMIYMKDPNIDKAVVKKELINEYFNLSALVGEANMSAKTQETLTKYFNAIVKNCDDILPDLAGFIETLPEDKAAKLTAVKNLISVLEAKECTESPEYEKLINILVETDPTSVDAQLAKAKLLEKNGKYSSAIEVYNQVKSLDATKAEEMDFRVLYCMSKTSSPMTVYNKAMATSGKYKGDALVIAARAVVANKDNCGASTFERKCNYYYAVELLERARAAGADVGGLIGSYRGGYPTSDEMFTESKNPGDKVFISCYNVSVTLQ